MSIQVKPFFHQASATISYIIYDDVNKVAAVIDTAYDFDIHTGQINTQFVDEQIAFIREHNLALLWILETHAHADHLTGAAYLQKQLGGKIGIGEGIKWVQSVFKQKFNIPDHELLADGQVFDVLLQDANTFMLGDYAFTVMATPGHTNDSVTYLIENHAFVGDTLFLPDVGSARCDFPGGSTVELFNSVNKIHQLPDNTILWMCHDYPATNRPINFSTTVKMSKQHNIHLATNQSLEKFIQLRTDRDKHLSAPKLLYPAIQINIRAGQLPKPHVNGQIYINLPLNIKE
ncbi:MBL fold metallo-hydrolase [Algibacillus agarilyticus]|uniref:MBL fold metallo-hydrolase n=1 Tax=Algibacillus agarilyticus TaxID=2234133 RepID=UPI000DCFFA22|nr:MBL fold metallo-hydrolase [Algibacillus agarilyticus]